MATYYVKNGGNDSAAGTSDGTAWATISKVNSSISGGDIVLFKRGDTWRNEDISVVNGSSGNYTTYGSYGTGAKPLILGSVQLNTGWTNQGSYIWQHSLGYSKQVGNLIFNNEESCGVKVATSGDLNAQGRFWYDYDNDLIQIYSAYNPASYYTNIEAALQRQLADVYGHIYLRFEYLDFRYSGEGTIFGDSDYIQVWRVEVSFNGGAFIDPGGGTRQGGGIGTWDNASFWDVQGCRISNEYDAGATNQGSTVTSVHDIIWRSNIIEKCEYNFEFWERGGECYNVWFEHNTCAYAGGGWGHTQRPSASGIALKISNFTASKSNIFIRNNIFYLATDCLVEYDYEPPYGDDLAGMTWDYNLYYNASGLIAFRNSSDIEFHTLADWQAKVGEANGVEGDPLFLDPTNGDFHLYPNSPALDAGLAVEGVDYDYDGNPYGTPPVIGALQNVSQVQGSTLLIGLMSYWPFDEITGNAIDKKGVIDLEVSATQNGGESGYSFNGVDQFVGNIDTLFEFTEPFTISARIKTTENTAWKFIVSNWYNGNGYCLGITDTGELFAQINNTEVYSGVGNLVNTGDFVIATLVWDGTNIIIYVGNVQLVGAAVESITYSGAERFEIGKRAGGYFWNGDIKHVAPWNRALTEGEIDELITTYGYPFTELISVSISVTSITVIASATTITVNDGTLQMSAHVDPHDATLQTVVWSVIAGTGFASINSTGLLTALLNGTVTVRATATDGSSIYGELEITITNQGVLPVVYKNIAPVGWHVPEDSEYNSLLLYLDPVGIPLVNTAGLALKEIGTIYWDAPNTGATNSTGFNGRGSGARSWIDGSFIHQKHTSHWWTITIDPTFPPVYGVGAWTWLLMYNSTRLAQGNYGIAFGASINAVMNDPSGWQEGDTVTDVDGNVYGTVKVGDQVWFAENLRTTRFNDGTPIPNVTDNTEWVNQTTAAMCWYNNEDPNDCPDGCGNMPSYRFFLSDASSMNEEVFPLNFLSTKLIDEAESGKIFKRRKFSGTLLFGGNSNVLDSEGTTHNRCDDWDLFWLYEQSNPCLTLYLTINQIRNGETKIHWEGYFSTTEGKFDIDRKTFEVTPLLNDKYTLLLENTNVQYNLINATPIVTVRTIYGHIFTRNRMLMDLINYIAGYVCPDATVSSTFFTSLINPATLAANDLLYLTIAQKSDIKRPAAQYGASTAMISWDELMNILWGMFQVLWDYNSVTNTINIEHISWWSHSEGLDLRGQTATIAANKYSYIKEEMPKIEKFSFMEAGDNRFVGVPITYDSSCVNQDQESNIKETIVNVTTDLELITNLETVDSVADSGFVILCNYMQGTDLYVRLNIKLNTPLGWITLHDNYFRHNRVLPEGNLNAVPVTFWTSQKNKLQELTTVICDITTFNPNDEITTELGYEYFGNGTDGGNIPAQVRRSEISPSGETKLLLVYGPADNPQTPVSQIKTVLIVTEPNNPDEVTNLFTAYLSEAANIDIVILIREIISHADGSVHCTGDWETWTIPTGEITDTFLLTQCALMQDVPGGSIRFEFDVTGASPWIVSY